jgi:hypothetical protein
MFSRLSASWTVLVLGLCALLFTTLSTVPAEAQTDQERSGARAAATAGAEAFDAGRYQEAVDYFTRAESLVHSPVHLIYMGRAQLKLGEWVKARENFLKISREGAPDGASEAVTQAVQDAEDELAALEPKLPYVTISVQGAPTGTEYKVSLDGEDLPSALLGVATPVDPGDHTLRATAPGYDSGDVSINITEGKRENVLLEVAATGEAPAAAPTESVPADDSMSTGAEASTDPMADTGAAPSGMRLGSYIALGVGAVGLGVGTIFALGAKSDADEADKLCGGNRSQCEVDEGTAEADKITKLNDDSGSKKTLAIVGFLVGGAGIGAGVALYVLSMDQGGGSANEPSVTPYVGLGEVGLTGRF